MKKYEEDFMKAFKTLAHRNHPFTIWSDFITMTACAISNALDKSHFEKREALYLETVKKYNEKELSLFMKLYALTIDSLDANPDQDFLGTIFMELDIRWKNQGQFFTPYQICAMKAQIATEMAVEKIEETGYFSISDPFCGAGATLIAAVNEIKKRLDGKGMNYQNHILVSGQDIDPIAARMCYIQLSLLGVAGYVKEGDVMTDPMTVRDSHENYWFTPMYFSNIWRWRRYIRGRML